MDFHASLEAVSVSAPFLPLTAFFWLVYTDPGIKLLGVIPPIAALLQLSLKPRAKLKVESFRILPLERDGNKGFRIAARIRSKGRPIVTNAEVKLQSDHNIPQEYVQASELEGKRTLNITHLKSFIESDRPIRASPKLRQGEKYEFEYPTDDGEIASVEMSPGKIAKTFGYGFFQYPTGKCKLTLLVQGDTIDGNTVTCSKRLSFLPS